jgi:hypothetical protein
MRNYLTLHLYTKKRLYCCCSTWLVAQAGADPGFQVRGGGAAVKQFAPSGGRHKFCMGYFVWQITILRQKIIFFPILGGGRAGYAPLDPSLTSGCGNWSWEELKLHWSFLLRDNSDLTILDYLTFSE